MTSTMEKKFIAAIFLLARYEFNIKANNLLSEVSFSEVITLSRLFSSYCMNIYGSPL